MLWIFIFTAVLNVFMTPGDTVWALKIFKFTLKITKEGIESGSLMVIRLLYLVMGTSLLTLTTSPLQLTDGIEKLLKPFNTLDLNKSSVTRNCNDDDYCNKIYSDACRRNGQDYESTNGKRCGL